MIRSVRQIIYGKTPGFEFHELIREANRFPRFTPHRFHFKGLNLSVTDFLSVAWQLKEIFLDEQMKFKADVTNPRIIDCGSNAGISVLYFKKLFPESRITAIEPDPHLLKALRENLLANKLSDVELIEKAVWSDDKGIDFGSDGADGGSVFLGTNKMHLPSVRLKEILEKEREVHMLKMDIEGAEVQVLEDCGNELSKVKNIFVEYHSWRNQLQKLDTLLALLTSHGFRYFIRSLGEPGTNPFLDEKGKEGMDIQLNIYAIKK